MNQRNFRRHGGTSIADEEGSTAKWLAAAVGMGVVLVVGFILLSGSGDDQAGKAELQVVDPAVDSTPAQTAPAANIGGPSADPYLLELPSADPSRAASQLEAELQSRRLWSSVEIDATVPSLIVVRSAYCDDAGVRESIAKLARRLREQGVTRIECYERHGELVFDRDL